MFRRRFSHLAIFLLLISTTLKAADAYTAVSSFFAEYDKLLETVAYRAQKVTSLTATEKMFSKEIRENFCATYFLRTNSKGKIIAKVTEAGVQPRDFRYIGKQKWFEVISMTNKPYYGYTKNRSGYYLFWNKPIHVRKKGGLHFGGSISAKINMKKSFMTIAAEEGVTFRVKLKRKTLFSNLPKGATNLVTKPLSIGGLPVLTISYLPSDESGTTTTRTVETKSSVSSNAVETVEKTSAESVKVAVKVSKSKSDKEITPKVAKESDKKSLKAPNDSEKKDDPETKIEKKPQGIPFVPIIISLLALLVLVIVAFVSVEKVKQKKLLEAIDNE